MAQVGGAPQQQGTPAWDGSDFRKVLEEWTNDHKMFAATLEELAGQLASVELQPPSSSHSREGGSASSRDGSKARLELLQRVAARAPSDRLQVFIDGTLDTRRLQQQLPEQLDQNLRLLGILAAEMRSFVRQMEGLADAAADAALSGTLADGEEACDTALLVAAVLDGASKETHLIEKAAEGITLTTPPDEVSAIATVVQLEPFLSDVLLAAVQQGSGEEEQEQ